MDEVVRPAEAAQDRVAVPRKDLYAAYQRRLFREALRKLGVLGKAVDCLDGAAGTSRLRQPQRAVAKAAADFQKALRLHRPYHVRQDAHLERVGWVDSALLSAAG